MQQPHQWRRCRKASRAASLRERQQRTRHISSKGCGVNLFSSGSGTQFITSVWWSRCASPRGFPGPPGGGVGLPKNGGQDVLTLGSFWGGAQMPNETFLHWGPQCFFRARQYFFHSSGKVQWPVPGTVVPAREQTERIATFVRIGFGRLEQIMLLVSPPRAHRHKDRCRERCRRQRRKGRQELVADEKVQVPFLPFAYLLWFRSC